MGRDCIVFISFILLSLLHDSASMDCEFGHESSWLDKIGVSVKSCPDDQYCCVEDNHVYCCNRAEFVSSSFSGLMPVMVAVAVGFMILVCLCCLCCPCCLLYQRRHRGTVYGNVLQPGVHNAVAAPQPTQQQTPVYAPQPTPVPMPMPMPTPGYSQTTSYPIYPAQAGQPPPPYSEVTANEVYSKQAPYNPHFQ